AVAALAEPTVMIAIFAMAFRTGSTSLDEIVRRGASDSLLLLTPGHLLAFLAFFIVALAETGRLPVDNPATHLELTMIHEAMVLEYSGRYLMLIEWAAGMKLLIFLALLSNLFFPWGIASTVTPPALAVACIALIVKIGALAIGIAALETSVAKLRLFRLPALLSSSFALALLAGISFLFVK
ncbi:MAG: formate hydrogenlyase, partial [candidate division NC10 bacterium]|nr:formate hydrogenlyase [candidate division NC10 bacterium]